MSTVTPRDILRDIESDLALLSTSMPDSVEAKVEAGSILWRVKDIASRILAQIKDDLRKEAIKLPASAQHEFEGQGSTATVKMPQPTLKVAEDADLDTLKKVLGDAFPDFFEEQVTVKPHAEFAQRVAAMEDEERRSLLLASVDRVENTPRVSFRRTDER